MKSNSMNYIQVGRGTPPMVFVHGYLCDHRNWKFQIDYFKGTNLVIACDLRGLGKSSLGKGEMSIEQMGQDVANLLLHLDITDAVLVGHSMGCRVIMEANRQLNSRVSGLILVDGSRGGQQRVRDQAKYDRDISDQGYRAVVERLFDAMFFGKPPIWKNSTLERVYSVREEIGRPLYRNLIAWDAEQLESAIRDIEIPVLIIQSTYINLERNRVRLEIDETSPYQEMLLSQLSKVVSVTIPSGHFTMIEKPDAVNSRIREFLNKYI